METNYRNWFKAWFERFKPLNNEWTSNLNMHGTVENSPWHREANVWVHTEMVVNEYIHLSPTVWSEADAIGALACAFHDTGKPAAKEEVSRSDGTKYFRFGGHEKISACLWRDYLTSFKHEFDDVFTNTDELFVKVAWLIEYHLPYSLGHDKLHGVISTNKAFDTTTIFYRMLRADARGRISDDHQQKMENVESWISETQISANLSNVAIYPKTFTSWYRKKVVLLIGISGSGKSTYTKENYPEATVFSFDALRLKWYGDETISDDVERYKQAFKKASEDNSFNNKATAEFNKLLKDPNVKTIVVDNMNLSAKSRRPFVAAATAQNAFVEGVVFVVSKTVVNARQKKRGDKYLGPGLIESQYLSLSVPCFGTEVDSLIVVQNG